MGTNINAGTQGDPDRDKALQGLAGLGVKPDGSGRITLWDKAGGKYVTGHPVDLAERVVHAGCSVDDLFCEHKLE